MKIKKLAYKTTLYLPTVDGNDQALSGKVLSHIKEEALNTLIGLGGGATIIDGEGYWKNEKELVEKMKTKLIVCYIDDIEEGLPLLEKLALWIKEKTNSKAVCFEVNDCLYIL